MMQKAAWSIFVLLLLFAIVFVTRSSAALPPLVGSHFDAAGFPNAFMTRGGYTRFVLCLGTLLPVALVALLTRVYSRANDLKLPNRDYWLAPERLARTRARLVAHGVSFGSLLVTMVCFVHWLVLGAYRRTPPQLSSAAIEAGMLTFFLISGGWIIVLLIAFRRPRGE
ncbi:MAG TPA: hypothetical protein VNZ02_04785 [Steroidobacteraceae bacterium]|jgi:hypothetical protein|nr:hypothetical protein [Steroidobacteraceae bacterium]